MSIVLQNDENVKLSTGYFIVNFATLCNISEKRQKTEKLSAFPVFLQ